MPWGKNQRKLGSSIHTLTEVLTVGKLQDEMQLLLPGCHGVSMPELPQNTCLGRLNRAWSRDIVARLSKSLHKRELSGTMQLINHIAPVKRGREKIFCS